MGQAEEPGLPFPPTTIMVSRGLRSPGERAALAQVFAGLRHDSFIGAMTGGRKAQGFVPHLNSKEAARGFSLVFPNRRRLNPNCRHSLVGPSPVDGRWQLSPGLL